MSLIGFHRFLIASAILFCFGFAGWELYAFSHSGATRELVLGAVFIVLGILLSFYLRRLKRFLNLPE